MTLAAALLLPLTVLASPAAAQASPEAAVEELLRTDRAFGEQAGAQDPIAVFETMLAEDVIAPNQERGLVTGRAAVLAMMRANPSYAHPLRWRPLRGGVSADGRHGFTFGYADAQGGDPTQRGRRYLAYWVKGPDGWRVSAYRQARRGPNEQMIAPMPPALPARMVAPDPAAADAHRLSVAAAEQAFSDRAQQVGLRAAFTEYGRDDAINMGNPTGFVVGAAAIGRTLFQEEATSPVTWNAERAWAASSGDLAITFGHVRLKQAPEGRPGSFPFFTIWRRDDPSQPWRYIAE